MDARAIRLIAIDLDGTLLDRQSRLPERNRAALHTAHEAGVRLVLCTGRTFTETRPVLEQIGLDLDATVTVGGALISDAQTGCTLQQTAMQPAVAREVAEWLHLREYAVMWVHDRGTYGFDGFAIDGPRRHEAIERWLQFGCKIRWIDALPDGSMLPLRISVVDDTDVLQPLSRSFVDRFGGRVAFNVIDVPLYGFTVLEAFDARVSKWNGVQALCRRWGIDPQVTAAIGDDVNDLSMIQGAGVGIAVGNARPDIQRAADRIVAPNTECGVAEAIQFLMEKL